MKPINFIHNLLEPFYFIISLYYSKISYKKYYQAFEKLIKNKKIFIIGAGPSIDNFNFNRISNSMVIFINGSVERADKIKKKNLIFFTSCDVSKIHYFIPNLKKNFKCIVTSSKYRGILDIIFSNHKTLYFHPKPALVFKKFNFFSIVKGRVPVFGPKMLDVSIKNAENIFYKNITTVTAGTSMLFILAAIMKMNPKSINLVGFDMGKVNNKHYASLKFYANKKVKRETKRYCFDYTKIVYKKILISIKKRNIKFNNYSIFKLENT